MKSDEIEDIRLSESLMILIDTLRHTLTHLPMISQEAANMTMDTFLNSIPHSLKQKLILAV
jgi:hypothetical protein